MKTQITILLCFIFLLTSCIGGRSPTPSFYILQDSAPNAPQSKEFTGPIIVMDFVNAPDYLKQRQIVIRDTEEAEVTLAEYHLWSEPLAEGCKRVLQRTMSSELSPINGVVVQSNLMQKSDWSLRIDIVRFDGRPGGNVFLDAVWRLTHAKGKSKLGRFTQTQPAGPTIADMVKTQSALLEMFGKALSKEILQQLPYEHVKE